MYDINLRTLKKWSRFRLKWTEVAFLVSFKIWYSTQCGHYVFLQRIHIHDSMRQTTQLTKYFVCIPYKKKTIIGCDMFFLYTWFKMQPCSQYEYIIDNSKNHIRLCYMSVFVFVYSYFIHLQIWSMMILKQQQSIKRIFLLACVVDRFVEMRWDWIQSGLLSPLINKWMYSVPSVTEVQLQVIEMMMIGCSTE